MLELSKYLGEGVQACFTEAEINPALNDLGEIFDERVLKVLGAADIDSDRIFNIRQVHGCTVLDCRESFFSLQAEDVPEADGTITAQANVILAVRTADCLPVFLYDSVRRIIGLVHAGWRSSKENISGVAVKLMKEHYDVNPADIKAVFGPSIHSCCYETGQEMCMVFPEAMIPRQGRWFLDLQQVNKDQLLQQGVQEHNIADLKMCTCCDKRFFSYRRQGKEAGRHLSLLRLREG